MLRSIRDAGFTPVPEDVRLVVTGTLQKRGDAFVLSLDRMSVPRDLVCVPSPGPAPGAASSSSNAPDGAIPDVAAVQSYLGMSVEVKGRFIGEKDGRLEVTAIRSIGDGK